MLGRSTSYSPRGLTTPRPGAFAARRPRSLLARAFEIYAERFAGQDGRVPATFEIITLTGWAPPEKPAG